MQLLQLQKVRDVERSEGKDACNSTATEHEQTHGACTSPERALNNGQGTANSLVTEIKEEPSTATVEGQGACNSLAKGIIEDRSSGISPGAHLREQGPGSKRGAKRKIPVNSAPSVKRCSVSVTRLLADNDAATEETTPSGDVMAVKRSRRTRKPTFSSSEWETPLDSPCRHGRISKTEKETKKIRAKSSPSVRVSRPKKRRSECEGLKDPVQKDECGAVTAGNAIIPSKLHEDEVRSDSTSVVAAAVCREADIKRDAAISEDTACGDGIDGEMNPVTQTGGSTDAMRADDGEEVTPSDDSAAKSQIEDNLADNVADAGNDYSITSKKVHCSLWCIHIPCIYSIQLSFKVTPARS